MAGVYPYLFVAVFLHCCGLASDEKLLPQTNVIGSFSALNKGEWETSDLGVQIGSDSKRKRRKMKQH